MVIDTDSWIVEHIFSKSLIVFCKLHIHPNVLSLLALVLSASLPVVHYYGWHKTVICFILMRQLLDLLDGPVARKCSKVSKIGGLLDTTADYIFTAALIYIVLAHFIGYNNATMFISLFFLVLMYVITSAMYSTKAIYDHSLLKNKNDFHGMLANNSIFVAIAIVILYYVHQNSISGKLSKI